MFSLIGTMADTQTVSSIKQPGGGPRPPPVMMMAPVDPGLRPPFMQMPRPPRPPFPVTEGIFYNDLINFCQICLDTLSIQKSPDINILYSSICQCIKCQLNIIIVHLISRYI